jgi:chaperonin GroES
VEVDEEKLLVCRVGELLGVLEEIGVCPYCSDEGVRGADACPICGREAGSAA